MADVRRVTSIQPQKKRKDRFSVFLDNEFAFGLSIDVLLASGIASGDLLTTEKVQQICELENRAQAKQKAFRLLAVRSQSRHELRQRLSRAHYSDDIITWVIAELDRLGLLDDKAFALEFARSRMATRPEGRFLLHQELRQKGIIEAEICAALDSVFDADTEQSIARDLAAKRKKRYRHLENQKAKMRVRDFLFRRGFASDIVYDILSDWEELE